MDVIGKVTEIRRDLYFEWKIQGFCSLSEDCYSSPSFSFAGELWHLDIYPYRYIEDDRVRYINLYLSREKSFPPLTCQFSISWKTLERKTFLEHGIETFDDENYYYASCLILSRSQLLEKRADLLPSDTLTIICNMKFPGCTHETKTEKLLDDFKRLMESGDHSDTTIQVKGQEFRLHRSILGARNPFFDSMFKSDMKEKNTGIVTIDDCEPDVFRSFVLFVYTGDVSDLSPEKVCDVYEVADRYQEDQLKEECLEFMKESISVDHFCDFIKIALRHDEKELLKCATDFFSSETEEIICSVKWLEFLKAFPVQANELHIKALKVHKESLAKKSS